MYFTASTYTKSSLKSEYKMLCKKLHPDKTKSDSKLFQDMQSEYDTINKQMVNDLWIRPVKRVDPIPVSHKSSYANQHSGLGAVIDTFVNMTPEQLEAIQSLLKIFIKPKKKKS